MLRVSLLLGIVLLPVACGEIRVERSGVDSSIAAQLAGEWVGSWHSDSAGSGVASSGELIVSVQTFRDIPVVEFKLDNPCLKPGDYTLVLRNGGIELLDGDVVVMHAVEVQDGQLVGTYDCALDRGSLTATWQRYLPTPLDLSGVWSGTLQAAGQDPEPLVVQLEQGVRSGDLVVQGTLSAPSLGIDLPIEGAVDFQVDGFTLNLQSQAEVTPVLLLSGEGSRSPLQLDLGLLQVLSGQAPFAQAAFRLAPEPE